MSVDVVCGVAVTVGAWERDVLSDDVVEGGMVADSDGDGDGIALSERVGVGVGDGDRELADVAESEWDGDPVTLFMDVVVAVGVVVRTGDADAVGVDVADWEPEVD